eukprot:NODE_526_length_7226_cov_0.465273.p2 type:complete len:286 gc:universal NODE_526_length_7226_cov_0.465273:3222-4079(+)
MNGLYSPTTVLNLSTSTVNLQTTTTIVPMTQTTSVAPTTVSMHATLSTMLTFQPTTALVSITLSKTTKNAQTSSVLPIVIPSSETTTNARNLQTSTALPSIISFSETTKIAQTSKMLDTTEFATSTSFGTSESTQLQDLSTTIKSFVLNIKTMESLPLPTTLRSEINSANSTASISGASMYFSNQNVITTVNSAVYISSHSAALVSTTLLQNPVATSTVHNISLATTSELYSSQTATGVNESGFVMWIIIGSITAVIVMLLGLKQFQKYQKRQSDLKKMILVILV